jgi:hypothetical protein
VGLPEKKKNDQSQKVNTTLFQSPNKLFIISDNSSITFQINLLTKPVYIYSLILFMSIMFAWSSKRERERKLFFSFFFPYGTKHSTRGHFQCKEGSEKKG